MKFRTSYLVGLMATVLAVSSTAYFIDPAVAADTPRLKPLKIMGPDGQIRQVNHQYGPTTSKDTFWSIAQKVRPDASVSVYQVMAALYDANPHAFNSASYNSLERGMILLIPSKEVMLSIPNRMAIARAEQSDRQSRAPAKATSKPPAKVTTAKAPVTAPAVIVETKVTPPKAVAETPVPEKPKMLSSDVTARLEAAESKNLSLTDELARTQDQLSVRTSDVEALKVKVEELNQRIAVLEETLQASKLQNQALKAEVEAAQVPETTAVEAEVETEAPIEPDDLWRNILNSPVLLIAAAVIPALFLLLAVFWFLRRKRNKERREMQTQEAVMAAGAAGIAGTAIMDMDDDDLDDMAVHLDSDHADSIDSLLDMGSVDLQPEQDLTDSHDQMDMASEMFVDPGISAEPEAEDEGQSLDDLWAEAMGDQEEDIVEEKPKSGNILEEADLDALLAGLGSDDSTSEDSTEAEEDLSELERNFASDLAQEDDSNDVTSKLNDVEVADTKPADEAIADDDDLDALLAEFSVPAEDTEIAQAPAPDVVASDDEDLSAAIAAELGDELDDELSREDVDDIDALLADFDKPTPVAEPEVEPDLGAEIAAELDAELNELGVEDTDDIDALLADFDKPAEPEVEPDLGAEIAAELDAELNELGVEDTDDIDALLADFDKPAEPEVEPDLGAEIAAELDAELDELGVEDTDDIDALLADFDKPTPAAEPEVEPDIRAEIAAELDDELNELGVEESDDIDSLLASFDAEPELKVDAEDDDISAEIAAELEASLPEDIKGEASGDDDLDALLAEFDVPEQLDADEDEFDFDMETAQLDSEDNSVDEDNLLKGIGAAHSIDGTDDTFTLVEELSDDNDADVLATAAVTLAAAAAAASVKEKESSFFNDLKANKSKDPHVLDWDSELDFAPKAKPAATQADVTANDVEPNKDATALDYASQEKPINATRNDIDFSEDFKLDIKEDADDLDLEQGLDLSDDNVLAAFTANTDYDDEDVLTSEDSFSLVDDHNLTVDEALAALDAQESRKAQKKFVPDHDLTSFQNENGFIDIDKLLNDADEEGADTDLYSEVDVEMSDVGALIGDAAMIDVDDEENSVNAKLDLARAYIEIDDSDSAKALLKEVQIDGNERQQDEAGRLLKEIS